MSGAQFNRIQKNRGRTELLRLALKKAQADEAKGDTRAAFDAYRTLAQNNFAEAAAHRKALQLGDLLGQTSTLAQDYRDLARRAMTVLQHATRAPRLQASWQIPPKRSQGFQKAIIWYWRRLGELTGGSVGFMSRRIYRAQIIGCINAVVKQINLLLLFRLQRQWWRSGCLLVQYAG